MTTTKKTEALAAPAVHSVKIDLTAHSRVEETQPQSGIWRALVWVETPGVAEPMKQSLGIYRSEAHAQAAVDNWVSGLALHVGRV